MATGSFPWQHSFPPFYTLQTHSETRKKQLEAWRSIVLDYCQRNGLTSIDVLEVASSPLFNNETIKRRLSAEAIQVVLEELRLNGNLEWVDPKSKRRCHIYWRSPEEWGSLIYSWANENGMVNTVCTFYELTEGEDSSRQPFHGLERELLVKSLRTLEKRNQAEIFESEDGVKFFST